MDNQTRKITDDEFNIFVESIYRQQIEEEIMNSIYGKQIAQFEKLGIGMGIEDIVSNYIAIAGMKYNKVGNVVLDESLLGEVYVDNLELISKELGVNLTRLSQGELNAILSNTDYAYKIAQNQSREEEKFVRKINGILNGKENTSLLDIIDKIGTLNIEENKFALSTIDMHNILAEMGISKDDAEKHVQKNEKNTMDTFVRTLEDAKLMQVIYYGHLIAIDESEFSKESFLEYFNVDIETLKKSQYYKFIIDENGEIDFQKMEEFYQEFNQKRNEAELTKDLGKYFSCKKLSEEDEIKLFKTLVVASKTDNSINRKQAILLAKKFRLDILDEENQFSTEKIQQCGMELLGEDFSIESTIEESTFNDSTFLSRIERFERSIINAGTKIDPKNADEANKFKARAKETERILCSKKEDITLNVLSGMNMSPEQIIALYCKFRALELNERQVSQLNQAPKDFTVNSVDNPQNNGIASILKRYIQSRPEEFSEYLSDKNNFKGKSVIDMLNEKSFSSKEETDIAAAFEHIRFQTKGIDKRIEKNSKAIIDLNGDLDKFIERGRENCTTSEVKNLYNQAKKLQKDDVLRTEILQKLKDFDSEMFDRKFKKSSVENVIGEGKAILYGKIAIGLRKAFVVMPQRIFDKNYRNMDITGVDNSILKRWQKNQKKQEKKAANEKENNNPNNLPAVKKVTIFDKIKNIFKGEKEEVANNIEEKEEIRSEKETTQGQTSASTGIRVETIDTTRVNENMQEMQNTFDKYKTETPVVQENSDQKDTPEDGERTSTDEGR